MYFYSLHRLPFRIKFAGTVEPQFNEPLFNKALDITNDILSPGQNYSKMYGIKPRDNEPRYNEHNPETQP